MSTSKTIEERVGELEVRVAKFETMLSSPQDNKSVAIKTKRLSVKEFLITKELKTETQKVIALGYYLEHIEGLESFNVADLEMAFRSAKEKLPKNLNDTVNKNIARGLLMEAKEKKGDKKAWVLTSTGEKYIEEKLTK